MTHTKTIFISAYRSVTVRHILYSDIFRELKSSGARLVVFLKEGELDYYRQRLDDDSVILEPVHFDAAMAQMRANQISMFFIILRKCFSGTAPGYGNPTDEFRIYQYGRQMSGGPRGRLLFQVIKVLAKLGSKSLVVRRSIVRLESFLFPGRMYDRYFEQYKPQLLITSSVGNMIDPYFMRAATRHGCRVVSVIHGWDNPSTKDYRGAEPDYVVAWNEIMKREVNVYHDIPSDRIYLGGIAHWDLYFDGRLSHGSKQQFLESNGLSEERKTILYTTSSWKKNPNTFDVIEQLLRAIKEDRLLSPCQLLVRMHPSYLMNSREGGERVLDSYEERIETLQRDYGDLVSFRPPKMTLLGDDIEMTVEDMHYLAETLYHSDVLLNEYSTVTFEAAIFDLPIINAALYNYRDTDKPASFEETLTHVKRMLQYGATRNAYSFEQLVEFINYYLEDRSRDQDKRRNLVDQEISTNRGCAGRAIGKYILSLAGIGDDTETPPPREEGRSATIPMKHGH